MRATVFIGNRMGHFCDRQVRSEKKGRIMKRLMSLLVLAALGLGPRAYASFSVGLSGSITSSWIRNYTVSF